MQKYFALYLNVEVVDVESRDIERDVHVYQSCSEALRQGYPLQQPGGYMGQMMPSTQPGQAPMPSQPPMPGQPPIPARPGYNQPPAPGTGIYQQLNSMIKLNAV
ncbi:galectin-3-like [Eurosta solidaginis]|uniref:galectin-3-like n=1 Tax=Eurosta solidaginis TaxID=178769 RepID=UPI0035317CD7